MSIDDCLLSVDVGMNALGWARWVTDLKCPDLSQPDTCGVIKVPSRLIRDTRDGTSWSERFRWLMREFELVAWNGHQPDAMALEWPEFRPGSAMGHAAAVRDNLTQLAFAAGAHACMGFLGNHDIKVELVPVSEWKGSLPKQVVENRIRRAIGSRAVDGTRFESHAWDAIGIGLHAMGFKLDGKEFA